MKGLFDRVFLLVFIALFVIIAMFLLVFIGPLFMPKYYDSYTEVTQKNVPPTLKNRSRIRPVPLRFRLWTA